MKTTFDAFSKAYSESICRFKNWQKFDAELSSFRRDRSVQNRKQMEDIQGERDRVFEEEIENPYGIHFVCIP